MPIPKVSISKLRAPARKMNIDDAVVFERIISAKDIEYRNSLLRKGVNPLSIERQDVFKLHEGRFSEETGELTKHGQSWLNNALSAIFKKKDTKHISLKTFIKAFIDSKNKARSEALVAKNNPEQIYHHFHKEMKLQLNESYKKIEEEPDVAKKMQIAEEWLTGYQDSKEKAELYEAGNKFSLSYQHELANCQYKFFCNLELRAFNNPTAQKINETFKYMSEAMLAVSNKYLGFLAKKLQGKYMHPKEIFQLALDSEEKYAKSKGVKIAISGREHINKLHPKNIVNANRFQDFDLYDILSNLIHNGVKYTAKNSTVKVKFNKQKVDNKNYLVFSVKDKGIGFPKDEIIDILIYGGRASNAKASGIEGTGFGLKHVKGILDEIRNKRTKTLEDSSIKIESPVSNSKKHPGTKVSVLIPVQD